MRFSVACEGVFNRHPAVFRSALVGVPRKGATEPVLCVELEAGTASGKKGAAPEALARELRELGARHACTEDIEPFLVHPAFPVDVRHNAKIFRERLAVWAARELGWPA